GKELNMLNRRLLHILLVIIIACLAMAWVDAVVSPDYWLKSLVKIALFLLLPASYFWRDKQVSLKSIFTFQQRGLLIPLLLGAGVYAFIVGAYFLLGPYFD